MKVTLDYDACHGHQSCAIAAPEVFGADDAQVHSREAQRATTSATP